MNTTTTPRATGEAAHTPTPWFRGPNGLVTKYVNNSGPIIARTHVAGQGLSTAEEDANASLIVRACNSHAALVEELQAMTDAYAKAMKDAGVTHYPEALAVVRKARAALSLARTP